MSVQPRSPSAKVPSLLKASSRLFSLLSSSTHPSSSLHLSSSSSAPTAAPVHSSSTALAVKMCEILSLSILQVLSVLSFLTSILAVLCVGSSSLYRLSHRLEAKFEAEMGTQSSMNTETWKPLWNWSGLPVSFSLGSIIGEDDRHATTNGYSGYIGGGDLMRMNWQVGRQQRSAVSHMFDVKNQPPLSMAKIIMSRHSQRRPMRLPRRTSGMPHPTPPSRLVETAV